jgi:CPA1 family monovalent cation:H+ antiporter
VVYGVSFTAVLILLRMVWMFPGTYLANFIRRRVLKQKERVPPASHIFVVGWTGMRGVVSLAAAIALPQTLANGTPFAQRSMIIFLAFCVILITLVLQGLSLPPLIRALGLAGVASQPSEEREARITIIQTALERLRKLRQDSDATSKEIYDDLAQHYRHRLAAVSEEGRTHKEESSRIYQTRFLKASRELLRVERETAVHLRNRRKISDDLLRDIEHELDLDEARLAAEK